MTAISYKKGAAFSVLFTVTGKIFSFVSSLLVAYYFGADAKTDIYFYLILLAALLNGWLQGMNTGIIVPEFMHIRQQDQQKAMGFANYFLYWYLFFTVLLIAWCYLMPAVTLSTISAFPQTEIQNNLHIIGLSAVYFTSFFVMTFLISLAESYKLFNIYILSPLNSLLPLIFILLTRKIEAMFIGYIAAYIIQIGACLIMLIKNEHWSFHVAKPPFSKKFISNLISHQPNSIAWAAVLYAPLFMVSSTQPGMVSAVNYSRMVSDTPLDVFVSKLNNVAKVKLTLQAAKDEFKEMASTLIRTDRILMFILIPVCVFTCLFAPDIVTMLFARGSFNAQDAHNTAVFLSMFILAVPFISIHNNLGNFFAALRLIKELVPRYFIVAAIFTLLFIISIKYWGAFAYPVVFLLLYFWIIIVNIITVKKFTPFLPYSEHIVNILKMFAVSFICAGLTKYIFGFYGGNIFIKIFINGSFFVLINTAVFYFTGDLKQFKNALNIKWKLQ